jgi:uncharacterized repeat protein (TIGR03803 family)
VYRLSKAEQLTVLHSFAGGMNHTDGLYPYGTPAMDKNGNLYGTTEEGGSLELGIIWKVSKNGTETVLHNFAGGSSDGANPFAGVIVDAKGNLYGDTAEGGSGANLGTVYELNKKGTLTLLRGFTVPDGASPYGGLIRDAKGNLYGTALGGGSRGYGTVWKLTTLVTNIKQGDRLEKLEPLRNNTRIRDKTTHDWVRRRVQTDSLMDRLHPEPDLRRLGQQRPRLYVYVGS